MKAKHLHTDTPDNRDAKVLKYAGYGHEFIAVCDDTGSNGPRRVSCECNELNSAKRLSKDCKGVKIYRRAGRLGWVCVK